jgi:transposase
MLLAPLIHAYSQGVQSSRAIERLCQRNAGNRLIAFGAQVWATTSPATL